MWEGRAQRFPEHTPNTREYYLLRSIFEEQFPSKQALATVPKVHCLLCCCRNWYGYAVLGCYHGDSHAQFVMPPVVLYIAFVKSPFGSLRTMLPSYLV